MNKMKRLVCLRNALPGTVTYGANANLLIFLDKRKSRLVNRNREGSRTYNDLSCFILDAVRKSKEDYILILDCIPYNVKDNYFITISPLVLSSDLDFRTHPYFIAYAENDDEMYNIITILDRRKVSEIKISEGHFIIIISDGNNDRIF